jgi:hypothetical protein
MKSSKLRKAISNHPVYTAHIFILSSFNDAFQFLPTCIETANDSYGIKAQYKAPLKSPSHNIKTGTNHSRM